MLLKYFYNIIQICILICYNYLLIKYTRFLDWCSIFFNNKLYSGFFFKKGYVTLEQLNAYIYLFSCHNF